MGGPMGDRMNNFNKVVVSTTMGTPTWKNTTLISSNVIEEIQKLKAQDGKDITVSGSTTLLQTLMKADLVDEYSLMVYPIVLGKGKRLFDGFHANLTLLEARPLSTGVVIMRYAPKR